MDHSLTCKKTSDANNVSGVSFREIVHLYVVPNSIVTDKDVKFTSHS